MWLFSNSKQALQSLKTHCIALNTLANGVGKININKVSLESNNGGMEIRRILFSPFKYLWTREQFGYWYQSGSIRYCWYWHCTKPRHTGPEGNPMIIAYYWGIQNSLYCYSLLFPFFFQFIHLSGLQPWPELVTDREGATQFDHLTHGIMGMRFRY